MNYLNQQAQLFLVAAVLMLLGMFLLFLALGLWAKCIDQFCRVIGIHGAITTWICRKENRDAWWRRVVIWYESTFSNRD